LVPFKNQQKLLISYGFQINRILIFEINISTKKSRKNQQENQYQHQYFQKNPQETTQETILFCLTARATCGLKAHTFCQGAPML
jgi:hypothetical protein